MSKQSKINRDKKIDPERIISYTVAILAIVLPLLDLVGDFINYLIPITDPIPSLSGVLSKLGVISIGTLLLISVQRRQHLDDIQSQLDNIVTSFTLGVQHLDRPDLVFQELTKSVREAEIYILAIGGRSSNIDYLNAIETKVSQGPITYHRLIAGPEITHELHEHLARLLPNTRVFIAWTHKEKFGNLTVTDHQCIFAFPAPVKDQLTGLLLPRDDDSKRYSQYFHAAYHNCPTIHTERPLAALCERCNPRNSENVDEIRKIVLEENQTFMEKKIGLKPEFL